VAQWAPSGHTLPLLVLVQLVLGLATSGLDLACNNIAFKVAPRGEATVYLGANGLLKSVCAGIAPVAGGLLVQALPHGSVHTLFVVSALLGALALLPLRRVKEAGEVSVRTVVGAYLQRLRARLARGDGRRGAPLALPMGVPMKYLPPPALDAASTAGISRGASSPLLPEAAVD
jgi:hypothetical protein